ncbi:TRAP transporter small permease [Falsochrobactrum shanghaiense]|uniref:TRAP transporter small permease protein n=1 Tax=Falsochrobactrum shanghaiense TaxID=2201899 RepID=A0A316J6S5_9HYPH|nr:TRAP transporter small permease [Falsochrobactrum shanghaiense]PWL16469.1 TRAP transporter small permease [Falsochrobactrum shanghaiense]
METVEQILKWITWVLSILTGLAAIAMLLHVNADVIMKYLANSPMPGTSEITARYYMLALVFLPLALIELKNAAVTVELFFDMFSPAVQRICLVIGYLAQGIFFGCLAYQSALSAWASYLKNEYVEGVHLIIVWPAAFILPVGFGLATVVSVLRLVQVIVRDDWQVLTGTHSENSAVTHAAD